jgi:hypothetical protein
MDQKTYNIIDFYWLFYGLTINFVRLKLIIKLVYFKD